MTPSDFYLKMLAAAATLETIEPTFRDPRAYCVLLAIAGQESNWQDVQQQGGPARGPWQFELNGILALTSNLQVSRYMPLLSRACGSNITPVYVHHDLIGNMPLAYGCARLLLRTAPWALPEIGDEEETLRQYRWCWRPGAWDQPERAADARARWARVYSQAVAAIKGACMAQAPSPIDPAPAGDAGEMENTNG